MRKGGKNFFKISSHLNWMYNVCDFSCFVFRSVCYIELLTSNFLCCGTVYLFLLNGTTKTELMMVNSKLLQYCPQKQLTWRIFCSLIDRIDISWICEGFAAEKFRPTHSIKVVFITCLDYKTDVDKILFNFINLLLFDKRCIKKCFVGRSLSLGYSCSEFF